MKNVRVRLVRKLAAMVDGVDLSGHSVGDTFGLKADDARLLIAEAWAVPAEPRGRRRERRKGECLSEMPTPATLGSVGGQTEPVRPADIRSRLRSDLR